MTSQTFHLKTEFITLSQLLKATGIVDRGCDAKPMIEEGQIKINGENEARRGRKIRIGDQVLLPDGLVIIVEGKLAQ